MKAEDEELNSFKLKFRAFKDERPLTAEEVEPVRNAIEILLKRIYHSSHVCFGCATEFDITDLEVNMYDHDGGFDVGLKSKQWLSIHCDHCGYETSLVKLAGNHMRNKKC